MDLSRAPRVATLVAALTLLPAIGICASAESARAQSSVQPEEPPPEAIELYRTGRAHYRAGRYHDAIVDLKAALDLDPESPNLIYNVAKVSELLGNLNEAIDYYRHYLRVLPGSETEERARISETIARLEGARQDLQVRAVTEADADLREWSAPEPAPARALGRADALFWVTAGAGVAMLGAGTVTGVLALQREKDVRGFVLGADGSIADRDALARSADSLAVSTDILLIAGGCSVAAATLLLLLREPKEEPAVAASLAVGRHSAALLVRGGF